MFSLENSHLIGKRFITKILSKGVTTIEVVEVIGVLTSKYSEEKAIYDALSRGVPEYAAENNNTSTFLVFWVKDFETGRTFRTNEFEIEYDVTGLPIEKINEKIAEIEEKHKEIQLQRKMSSIGLDLHYMKCVDVGMSEEELEKAIVEYLHYKIKKKDE